MKQRVYSLAIACNDSFGVKLLSIILLLLVSN
jgi:hypothetical protein